MPGERPSRFVRSSRVPNTDSPQTAGPSGPAVNVGSSGGDILNILHGESTSEPNFLYSKHPHLNLTPQNVNFATPSDFQAEGFLGDTGEGSGSL